MWTGELLHIHIAEAASFEMEELDQAELIAGRGIVGDRYFNGHGNLFTEAGRARGYADRDRGA